MKGRLCSEKAEKVRADKVRDIQKQIKTVLEEAYKRVHGGDPLELIRKQLEASGYAISGEVSESVRYHALTPAQMREADAEQRPTFPQETEVLSALGVKKINCDQDFSKLPASERAALLIELEAELKVLFTRVTLSSDSFPMADPTQYSDSRSPFKNLKKALVDMGIADEAAYLFDRSDYDQKSREQIFPLWERYAAVLRAETLRAKAEIRSKIEARRRLMLDFWVMRRLHEKVFGNHDNTRAGFQAEYSTYSSNQVSVLTMDEAIMRTNEENLEKMRKHFLSNIAGKETKVLEEALTGERNNSAVPESADAKALASALVAAHKRRAPQSELETRLDALLAKWSDDPKRIESDFERHLSSVLSPKPEEGEAAKFVQYCERRKSLHRESINEIVQKAFKKLSTARPVVEAVTNYFYSPQERASLKRMFDATKKQFATVLDRKVLPAIKNPVTRARLKSQFERTELNLPLEPAKMKYNSGELPGVETLDLEQLTMFDYYYSSFSNPNLSAFTNQNAFYMPDLGTLPGSRKVVILPGVSKAFADVPEGLMAVVGHELGHSVDPNSARLTKIEVGQDYRALLDCFRSKTSVAAVAGQAGECFSDWMSAEVAALTIAGAPETQRFEIAQRYAGFYCYMAKEDSFRRAGGEHPASLRRLNAIFGAHPIIRKAIGCPAKGPYDYCTLGGAQ